MYMVLVLRALFVVLAFFVGLGVAQTFQFDVTFPILMAALAAALVTVEVVFQSRYLETIVAVFVGMILGVFVMYVLTRLLELLVPPSFYQEFIQGLIPVLTLFIIYITIQVVLQTKDRFRLLIPYVDFSNQGRRTGGLALDTSVLIDGRIADLCETEVLDSEVIIPKFVLRELQTLADSSDKIRRAKGKRGLDAVARLQQHKRLVVRVDETDYPGIEGVDAKLVRMAREKDAKVLTTDANLVKMGRIEGVGVVNLNDVAGALRPVVLLGQDIAVRVVRPGEKTGQGVGFLDDGTLVVVENGKPFIGQEIPVVVANIQQTQAGRMVFARRIEAPPAEAAGEKKAGS